MWTGPYWMPLSSLALRREAGARKAGLPSEEQALVAEFAGLVRSAIVAKLDVDVGKLDLISSRSDVVLEIITICNEAAAARM